MIKTRSDKDLRCIEGNLPAYVFIIYPTTEEQHFNLSASDYKGNGWQFWQNSILMKNESVNFELILNKFYLAVI